MNNIRPKTVKNAVNMENNRIITINMKLMDRIVKLSIPFSVSTGIQQVDQEDPFVSFFLHRAQKALEDLIDMMEREPRGSKK